VTYLDSSVILAIVYGERDRLDSASFREPVMSRIGIVECHRSLDRLRLRGTLDGKRLLRLRETIVRLLRTVSLVELEDALLDRAADAFPLPLRTLDAIHLATALRCRQEEGGDVAFATHDRALAAAARAYGFPVVGV
jgi:predicted nucleic acid-binding protein